MNPDECIEIMKSLCDLYHRASETPIVSPHKAYRLKHTLTELELIMISIRKSVEKINNNQKIVCKK